MTDLDLENIATNPHYLSDKPNDLNSIFIKNYSRRSVVMTAGAAGASLMVGGCSDKAAPPKKDLSNIANGFNFTPIPHGVDEHTHIPPEYQLDVLLRWGDPIIKGAPEFDPYDQSAEKQEQQFGFNNDYIGFLQLNNSQDRAVLCVNHEYSLGHMMFPQGDNGTLSEYEKSAIMQASLGNSIIEIHKQQDGNWTPILDSPLNRRISLLSTPIGITGPALGHDRMKTTDNPGGDEIIGTFQNCAGGMTPWGTYLTCEENINYGFGNLKKADIIEPDLQKLQRFSFGESQPWYKDFPRFDMAKNPNEANRFGWVVEIDPLDPTSKPVKHTALGRFKHEGCSVTLDPSGHAVAYMGDDQYFEYFYKFVSKRKYIQGDKAANMRLLADGTLYVAKFHAQGTLEWLPLIYGENGLTAENGFHNAGDVMIDARLAGDIVGATPMDRPEDVEIHPKNGKIYVSLTNNPKRITGNAPNPRPLNIYGHILEVDTKHDHINTQHKWNILLHGGAPTKDGKSNGQLSCPDNLAFDADGRFWVCTDQGNAWKAISGNSDGLYGVPTKGESRGQGSLFFRSPIGAETTGICFTPDVKTLFLSVQHPSADATDKWEKFGRKSNFDDPATRWPDFDPKMPPRPSVVQIIRKNKTKI